MHRREFLGALVAAPLALGFRARTARADVMLPSTFAADNGAFDLVIHFHGLLTWQEPAFERAAMRAALASVNLGEGSGVYERAFRTAEALERVIEDAARAVAKSGAAAGATVGRVALSAWSAGFGAVGALIALPEAVRRVDAVLLEDALHASYVGAPPEPDPRTLEKWARFGELAVRGEKLFGFSHSAVRAPGYASTTECAAALLKRMGIAKDGAARDALGARGVYSARRGSFVVLGFGGGGIEEHRDHVRRVDETLLPLLRTRWER